MGRQNEARFLIFYIAMVKGNPPVVGTKDLLFIRPGEELLVDLDLLLKKFDFGASIGGGSS